MKTNNFILSVLLLIVGCSQSKKEVRDNSTQQESFYSTVQMGEYSVGFCDSVIYNSDLRFEILASEEMSYVQYDYSGATPLFLQIWHPIEKATSDQFLTFGDFRKRNLSPELQSVYRALCSKMDSFFIQYNIIEDFVDYAPINYGAHSNTDVLDTLMSSRTKSSFSRIENKSDFPVIVYHHGGQGLSDENFILAEYFASRGYVVVSSNFHLPFKDRVYGYEGVVFDDMELPKSVIEFARTLTTNQLYFVGHSAGAQVGFKLLYDPNWVDAFVSLETTLEGREVDYIKDGWSKLHKVIDTHKTDYSIPVLMVANTMENKPFPLFDELSNTPMIQASQKELFGHESYTSGYIMRYHYRDLFTQPDTTELKAQLRLYNENLKLIEAFLDGVADETILNTEDFEKDFFFSTFNVEK